jgi:hypothetical protein
MSGPEMALAGTMVEMAVVVQLEVVAVDPLNVTVPVVVPKLAPFIVTEAPAAPEVVERFWIDGDPVTVNGIELLAS